MFKRDVVFLLEFYKYVVRENELQAVIYIFKRDDIARARALVDIMDRDK